MKKPPYLITLVLILVFVTLVILQIVSYADSNGFCSFAKSFYPDLQWKKLNKGDHLNTYDAILTCDFATVVVRSDLLFNKSFEWNQKNGEYEGRIPSNVLLVIRTHGGDKIKSDAKVKILEVKGEAFYSADRDLIQEYGFTLINSQEQKQMEEARKLHDDLIAVGWKPADINQPLDPWDMVWTQKTGRIEIEILKEAVSIIEEDGTTNKTQNQSSTLKEIPPNSYFIMYPHFFLSAKLKKITGEAWIASNRNKVREFSEKYHRPRNSYFNYSSPDSQD
jgi:hypothetical protein